MEKTTKEQSIKLLQIGLHPNTADFIENGIPVWTFETLMRFIPGVLNYKNTQYRLYITKYGGHGSTFYKMFFRPKGGHPEDFMPEFPQIKDNSLLNLAYRAVMRLEAEHLVEDEDWPCYLDLSHQEYKIQKLVESQSGY